MLGIAMVDLLASVILLLIMSFTKLGTLKIERDSVLEEMPQNHLLKEDQAESLDSSGLL